LRVGPLFEIDLEQSPITEFISHLSCPAADRQPINPRGVLPGRLPKPAIAAGPPNAGDRPTATPNADNREKMWCSIALTSPQLG
jgi:hypothetical protein